MFFLKYLIITNKLLIFFNYFIPYCKINSLYNLFSKNENINKNDIYTNKNINNLYINKNIIRKSVSIERIDDVNFYIDDGPIYI